MSRFFYNFQLPLFFRPMISRLLSHGLHPSLRVQIICACLVGMVFSVYGQTIFHDFVNYDDDFYVTTNQHVSKGLTLSNLQWVWSAGFGSQSRDADNWIPLTMISHMVDVQLFGSRAGGHHAVSLLIHSINSIFLFLVLRSMTSALWKSAFVAALFAVHPLHVESVAWIAERKDLLSGFFFMLMLAIYLRMVSRPFKWSNYLLLLLCFTLGLLSKPMLVTTPFILLLLDWWPLNRWRSLSPWRLFLEKLPIIALSVADCIITLQVQHAALSSWDRLTVSMRASNALLSYMAYLSKAIYPHALCVFYPLTIHDSVDRSVYLMTVSLLLLGGLTMIGVLLRRRMPYLLFGWLWFLGMLVPVIGIIQVGSQAYADRYTYLPLIGIFIALTWLLGEWVERAQLSRSVVAYTAVMILILLMTVAAKQTSVWRNSITLWSNALETAWQNPIAENNLGEALTINAVSSAEAIPHFLRAIKFNANYTEAINNLGKAYLADGRTEDAIVQFRRALQIDPKYAKAHTNLGVAMETEGRLVPAISEFREAILLDTESEPLFYYNLGNALMKHGEYKLALQILQQFLQLDSKFAPAYGDMGICLLKEGSTKEAGLLFQQALHVDPGYDEARVNLGSALLLQGDINGAIKEYRTSLDLHPSNRLVIKNLISALNRIGRFGEAEKLEEQMHHSGTQ